MRGVEEKAREQRAILRFSRRLSSAAGVVVVLALGAVVAEPAGQAPIPNPLGQRQQSPFDNTPDLDPLLAARQLRALNAERQKVMVTDTERILKLAQEVDSDIESGDLDAFSAVQVRKISDIEKLARDVKQKMSTSLVGGPSFHDPGPPPIR
jgi:hypothetical protein